MKILRDKVKKLAVAELVLANEHFPPFASDHEGFAVILEETNEAKEDMDELERRIVRLMKAIFMDAPYDDKRKIIDGIEVYATELACEAIQVSAMCQKFRMSHKERKDESSNFDR